MESKTACAVDASKSKFAAFLLLSTNKSCNTFFFPMSMVVCTGDDGSSRENFVVLVLVLVLRLVADSIIFLFELLIPKMPDDKLVRKILLLLL